MLLLHSAACLPPCSEVYAIPHRDLAVPTTYVKASSNLCAITWPVVVQPHAATMARQLCTEAATCLLSSMLQVVYGSNASLLISPGHLLFTSRRAGGGAGCSSAAPATFAAVPASAVRAGDCVLTADGGSGPAAAVVRVERVQLPGKVAPLTMQGTLVVDGLLASAYATRGLVSHTVSHAALAPLRW